MSTLKVFVKTKCAHNLQSHSKRSFNAYTRALYADTSSESGFGVKVGNFTIGSRKKGSASANAKSAQNRHSNSSYNAKGNLNDSFLSRGDSSIFSRKGKGVFNSAYKNQNSEALPQIRSRENLSRRSEAPSPNKADNVDSRNNSNRVLLKQEALRPKLHSSADEEEKRVRRKHASKKLTSTTTQKSTGSNPITNKTSPITKQRKQNLIDRERHRGDTRQVLENDDLSQNLKPRGKQAEPVLLELQATPIALPSFITVSNFSRLLGVRVSELITKLADFGFDQVDFDLILNYEDASLVAMEYGFEPETADGRRDIFPEPLPENMSHLPVRPPFVTIMGHVDHGKTTILDYLRKSSIVASEFGGITQHIGAFSVKLSSGKQITFLDTPGHAAFLKMRQRGANVTDIVVLVVAADDSVMPQTIEAIRHAQSSKVPVIVAINKIDKPGVDIERVRRDLAANGVYVESFGGETTEVAVSGLTGKGISDLEENIIALSEILDNRADPSAKTEGWVIESSPKKGRGNTATVVVRKGTLKPGTFIVAGTTYARIRSLRDDLGAVIKFAGPGQPVEIDGWKELPEAGDEFLQTDTEQHSNSISQYRKAREQHAKEFKDIEVINEKRRADRKQHLEELKNEKENKHFGVRRQPKAFIVESTNDDSTKYERFIIRGDVSGSVEAITDAVVGLGTDEARCKVILADVGSPTASDVDLAEVGGAIILCFNVKPDRDTADQAAKKGVKIVSHTVIYRLLEDVSDMLAALIAPTHEQKILGEAEVRAIFNVTDKKSKSMSQVAGCRMTSGVVKRSSKVKATRNDNVVFDGSIDSLKQGKETVNEVKGGTEFGLTVKNWDAFAVADRLQFYETVQLS
ncbi:hypothetical protein V1512DRAFT_268337 [Lipomyces arxii]|uniref:uncharacterized protein n=1 Tax=Lipomyces arxii TaxID=56418 RepID=UPI0034CDDBF4